MIITRYPVACRWEVHSTYSPYNANTHTPEIQIVAETPVGPFIKTDSDTVTIKGGMM